MTAQPARLPRSTLSAGSGRRIAIVFALVLLMACAVPYLVAIGGLPDNLSLAVASGFDQRTAVLGITGMLALASLWAARRPIAATLQVPDDNVSGYPGLDTAFSLTVAALLAVAVLLYLNGDDRYNEIWYFTDRHSLMALGRVPYRDFMFNYGPLLAWVPHAVDRALPGDWLRAYVIADAGFLLLSLILVRHLVGAMPVPDRTRGPVFLALGLFWLPLSYASGLHYSGIRFVVPVVLVFDMARLRGAGPGRLCWQPLGATLIAAALSFEVAIVMAVTSLGVLAFLAAAERRRAPLAALLVVAAVLAALVALLPAAFVVPLTANFSGREFPLVPGVFLLFVVFSLSVAALCGLPPLLRAAWTGRLVQADGDLGLCLVAVFALLMVPGGFGRADFVHMFAYGFGAVVVTLAWAANGSRLRLLVYGAIAIELVAYNHFLFFKPLLGDLSRGGLARLLGADTPSPAAARALAAASTGQTVAADRLAAYPGLYDPFFVALPSPQVELGYYTGTADVLGPAAIARKTAELNRSRHYLLPATVALRSSPTAALAYERRVFGYLLAWPLPLPFRPPDSAGALAAFIAAAVDGCRPVGRIDDVVICARVASEPAARRRLQPAPKHSTGAR
ncbi:hypothetical protein [Sandarakinorhabdus sp. DWP1-3-1]|uniref:hypothetical protein n=1 Tax=Sandarakinorhabdus sp. DWP1-3-1 TaxID=2804627 RepID=UPI003CEA3D58